ncbi:MAG: tetratricopeptide repeat protein [Myxococcales bacterium]|jgi:TolA-binding protein
MDRKTDQMVEPRGIEKELADLRREVLESRNLVIKTDNLLKNLHAELKSVAKRNDEAYRRTWISSAAAYALFLAAAIGLAALGARAFIVAERHETEAARAEAEKAQRQAAELTAQLAQERAARSEEHQASAKALMAFKTLAEKAGDERLKGLEELVAIDRTRLSELEKRVLDDASRSLKNEVGGVAFDRGKSAFRRNDMPRAIAELQRFLSLDPQGSDVYYANFLLGAALYQQRDYEGAAKHLEVFAANSKGQRNVDYGLYLLGQSHEQLGNNDRAKAVYRRGLAEFPNGDYTGNMQRRLRMLEQTSAAAGGAPEAGTAVGGAGSQPSEISGN